MKDRFFKCVVCMIIIAMLSSISPWMVKAEENEKWWVQLEAEEGELYGAAQIETPNNLGGSVTLAGYLDGGEEVSALTLKVRTDFTDVVQMVVRYRSGENRNLCYRVNGKDENVLENLNSGDWAVMADSEPVSIELEEGENEIKFYAPEGENAPGVDFITLSRNGGKQEDMAQNEEQRKAVTIRFEADGIQQGDTLIKEANSVIGEDEVPRTPEKDGYDFLGWYWGSSLNYEAVFPMNLSEVPESILKKYEGNELVFTARYGHHVPANPVEKEGYRLIFQDEFDGEGSGLNLDKWVDRYLSSWSTSASNTNVWTQKDGIMNIQIQEETNPWCPEFDGMTVVTGFTTGQRNGLHNWNGNNAVRNPEDVRLTHINQYGYYEMRAKCQSGSSRHSAWWLLGFEDVPEESAEIDIFEVLGKNNHQVPPAIHKWKDSDAFVEGLPAYTNYEKDFNNEYHVYGFDWQEGTSGDASYPDKIIFYVDGVKTAEKNVNIDYPMIQLLSLYEKRAGGWTGAWEWMPYPNSFEIDYVRVYKKLPDGQEAIPEDQLEVTGITATDLTIHADEAVLKTYKLADGSVYTEKTLAGTKSYVRVEWNDGVETQEPVVWDEITAADLRNLKMGKTVEKSGNVESIGKTVTMEISVAGLPEIVLDSIKVTAPEKTEYEVGDTFDAAGLKVEAIYSDGTVEDVTEDAEINGFESDTIGEKQISITYEDKSESFTISVKEKEQSAEPGSGDSGTGDNGTGDNGTGNGGTGDSGMSNDGMDTGDGQTVQDGQVQSKPAVNNNLKEDTAKSAGHKTAVKTGDESHVRSCVLLVMVSFGCAGISLRRRKHL